MRTIGVVLLIILVVGWPALLAGLWAGLTGQSEAAGGIVAILGMVIWY
jgi:hypothetical protein